MSVLGYRKTVITEKISQDLIHRIDLTMQTTPHITPRAGMIMNLLIQGLKPGQIAERIGMSSAWLSTIMNGPQFKDQLAIRREAIENRIDSGVIDHMNEDVAQANEAERVLRAHAAETARNVVRLIEGDNANVSLRASQDLLDRVGPQKRSGVDITQASITIDIKSAMLIKETFEMESSSELESVTKQP